jgi:hypothetical protein
MSAARKLRKSIDWSSPEGKGTAGCLVFVLLLAIGTFIALNVGPSYLASRSFEADLKTEVSRAGARFYANDTLLKEVLLLAKKNEVRIAPENVRIERYSNQIFVKVKYSLPIDLYFYEYIMNVDIKASSYIGTL